VAAACRVAPVLWRRLLDYLPRGRPALAALFGRLSDRLTRGRERRARSCYPLFLPLLPKHRAKRTTLEFRWLCLKHQATVSALQYKLVSFC
uniref:Uncharacterized protein n=1 Tax=Podarcis muralis TaxID=64176 RepID=A0A670I4U6_PODMU